MKPKLAAIYNIWDGEELLKYSVKSIEKGVDLIIMVYQDVSNFGEEYSPLPEILKIKTSVEVVLIKCEPIISLGGTANEKIKRNIGLEAARERGCTHFLSMDCDEMYENFDVISRYIINTTHLDATVCGLHTYFKYPTLRFNIPEAYYVPFIHRIHPETSLGYGSYPYYVDPTRKVYLERSRVCCVIETFMHHFSFVRKDINRKFRNSSAKANLGKSNLLNIYNSDVKAGVIIEDYKRILVEVPNTFGIHLDTL